VQRFVAAARGAGDHAGALRVFWSTLLLYALIGAVLLAALELLAPTIASLFHLPPELEDDAADLLRIVGLALPLGLLVAAFANVLQGFERFTAVAVTAALGSVAYITALVLLVGDDVSLPDLGWAVIAQQGVLLLTRAALVLDVIATRPGLVSRRDARAMASMSARLQVVTVSLIVNGQSDRVVAGAVAPPATVAQVGIAAQVAESGRMVAAAPLVPITNRLSSLHGAGEDEELHATFARADRLWAVAVLGATAIGAACAAPLIRGWLGAGYGTAGALAAMLVLAYGSNLVLGVRSTYLRATGRPGLESRASVVLMVLNVAFTIPLAIAFGVWGVVSGTLAAYLLGTAWYARRFTVETPEADPIRVRELVRPAALAVVLAAVGAAWSVLTVGLVPPGWGLIPVGVGIAGAWAAYLALALRIPLSRDGLRRLRV
jgi:O-antigen/teichoic acid export membrane protein